MIKSPLGDENEYRWYKKDTNPLLTLTFPFMQNVCEEAIHTPRQTHEAFTVIYTPEELKYPELTVLQGDIIRRARLEWVERAIAILENKEGE